MNAEIVEPCNICGNKEVNLVDGFYYCAECGTQDVNVRETIVERTELADGTFARVNISRFTTALKDGIEMSGEWYKWHAYNFMLCGLADELVELGVEPNFKMKVLWIWSRYIKKFQVLEDMGLSKIIDGNDLNHTTDGQEENISDDAEMENDSFNHTEEDISSKTHKEQKYFMDIKILTKEVLISILYVALNLSFSDFQISHILKFIREGRLSYLDCIKFVPKEINTKKIPQWNNFARCSNSLIRPINIRDFSLTIFKRLDLGCPLVPDLRKLADNYLKELSLPATFKDLVFSLMDLAPCDFLQVNKHSRQTIVRVPDFECVVMSYILVALKMCFGLDDQYEINLSNAVDKLNNDNGYEQSYKFGFTSNPTDRMFSFCEWCKYYQFRKSILCKYYLPIAKQYNADVDDYVLMEQLEERKKRKVLLSEEVTMDILNKIPLVADAAVIPKSEFYPTLTPYSTYTAIISEYIQDPDLRLLLIEDFTQYSIKYISQDVKLNDPLSSKNIIEGISEANKIVNKTITGLLFTQAKANMSKVFVRNCENKNWLKTKPPKEKHIRKMKENTNNDKDSDCGYDSNIDNTLDEYESEDTSDDKRELEKIEEETAGVCIFDNNFPNIEIDNINSIEDTKTNINNNFFDSNLEENLRDSESCYINRSDTEDSMMPRYNPETFDRESTIREIILTMCKKHGIPIPKEYKNENPNKRNYKRKNIYIDNETGVTEPKVRKIGNRAKPGELRKKINELISTYFSLLGEDVILNISNHVKTVMESLQQQALEITESVANVSDANDMENADLISEAQAIQNNLFNIAERDESQNSDEEANNHSIDDFIKESDPTFNDKEYDIRQLYLKCKDEINFEEFSDYEDEDIENIISKKVEQYRNGLVDKNKSSLEINEYLSDTSESEDEIQLSVLKNALEQHKHQLDDRKSYPPLIETTEHITKFKYWLRHYTSQQWRKTRLLSQAFDLELLENCPKSFTFVIRECAAIIESPPFALYKQLQIIEPLIIKKIGS